jgi:uncharacterized membrane-anchored protein
MKHPYGWIMGPTGRPLHVALAGLLLTAGLTASLGYHSWQVANGREVVLPAQGYDPRNLLTGHYVALRTPIHRAQMTLSHQLQAEALRGQRVWVLLQRFSPEADWQVADVLSARPLAGDVAEGAVLLRAQVVDSGVETAWLGDTPAPDGAERAFPVAAGRAWVELIYGIERYHTRQSEAEALEDWLASERAAGSVSVRVVVGTDGQARLRGVLINGEPLEAVGVPKPIPTLPTPDPAAP